MIFCQAAKVTDHVRASKYHVHHIQLIIVNMKVIFYISTMNNNN